MVTTHKFQSTAMVRSFACPATTPLRLSKSLVTCQQRHQRAEQAQHQAIPACVSHHLGFSVDLRLPTTVHVPVRDEPSTTGPVILSSTTVLLSDSIDNILQQLQKDLGPSVCQSKVVRITSCEWTPLSPGSLTRRTLRR